VSTPKNNHFDQKNYTELYKLTFESSPISITLLDLKGQIIDVNRATEELSALDRDQLIGTHYLELKVFPENTLIELKNIFQDIIRGRSIGPIEMQITTAKNKKRWISVVGSLVKFQDRSLIQVLTNDITQRKLLEIKLQESEEKYQLITHSINDLITVVNSKMEIEYINEDIHHKIMGYKKEDLIGINSLHLIHPDDREKTLQKFKEALNGEEKFAEVRIRHKDGHYVWTETNGKMIIN
jgi:PAS domain S-box-containing protein